MNNILQRKVLPWRKHLILTKNWGVLQYDFYLFATLLQVATIIYYYFLLFLLNLNILSVYHTEQYTCTTINRCHTTLYRIICKMF